MSFSISSCPLYTLTFVLTCSCIVGGCSFKVSQPLPELITVEHVDLKRYTGLWHEIAKLPNRFQKHCVRDTTATYTALDDGKIAVLNRCIDKTGEPDEAHGIARVVTPQSNARLEVSFVSLFGFHLFWGDYWIIDLGNRYEYAIVGTPSREYGWVLSRTPTLDEVTLKKIYSKLQQQGYDPQAFEMSPQSTS